MQKDTDKTIEQVIAQNPGIPKEQESYVYCNNKKPVHKGTRNLTNKPRNTFNSIAIKTNECNYMCLDFDGYSDATDEVTYKKEKQATAEKIKDNFIALLDERTSKYRIDKTASNKYHVWLKHPNVPNKEFLKLPKFLTTDGAIIPGIVEVFSKFNKHNVHLAGSTITENDKTIGAYENVYSGASFDELESVENVTALLISAITSAGYIVKLEQAEKISNTVKYHFLDAKHNGFIKRVTRNGNYYFSYLENEIIVSKNFYAVSIDDFSINHIVANCSDEFISILCSIYYYHIDNVDVINENSDGASINQDIGKELIEVYKKYWENTKGNRHYLMLATSHVLVKYLRFNESDLYAFFDELADSVDDIDDAHRNVITEGLKPGNDKEYGIPTIIEILQCDKQELSFLAKTSDAVQNELEYIERIKPSLKNLFEKSNSFIRKSLWLYFGFISVVSVFFRETKSEKSSLINNDNLGRGISILDWDKIKSLLFSISSKSIYDDILNVILNINFID